MKRFVAKTKAKEVIQLIDIEGMESWSPHMPLIFTKYIEENRLKKYTPAVKKQILTYLEKVKKEVAIPKLIEALENPDTKIRKKVAKNLFLLSENQKEIENIKPTIEYVNKAFENEKIKEIKDFFQKILNNWDKNEKKKKNATTRKKINDIKSQLDTLETEWETGKVTDNAYIKKKKDLRAQIGALEKKLI